MKKLILIIAVSIGVAGSAFVPISSNSGAKALDKSASFLPSFNFFRIHHQTRFGVTSTWGVSSEAGAVGYIVKKTDQDPNDPYAMWQTVSMVPCSGSRSYKVTDLSNSAGGYLNYKVVIMMADGSEIESGFLTIHIIQH